MFLILYPASSSSSSVSSSAASASISLTQLCHTPYFTHLLTHTTLSHTIFHTPSHSHNFVTHHLSQLSYIQLCQTHTQLCHTSSFTHIWLSVDAVTFCVAGVALGDIHLRFAWQAWHLATSALVLRGMRGTWGNV